MSKLTDGAMTEMRSKLSERSDVAVTHVFARRSATAALKDAVRVATGLDLPSGPRAVETQGVMIVWTGPDQWLFIEPFNDTDRAPEHARNLQGLASVVDVSDSRVIFRVNQAQPSDAFVRSMGIDLDATSFKPGDVAITHVSHLGLIIWRLPDGSGYEFACARTYSREFLGWLQKI